MPVKHHNLLSSDVAFFGNAACAVITLGLGLPRFCLPSQLHVVRVRFSCCIAIVSVLIVSLRIVSVCESCACARLRSLLSYVQSATLSHHCARACRSFGLSTPRSCAAL